MKRSAALQPLSRDHHQALYAALQLTRADEVQARGAVEAFLSFWQEHGQRHFRIEEEVLLPGAAIGGVDPEDPRVVQVLSQHVGIRARAKRLTVEADIEQLHELGGLLTAHVRLEENELFPLIEGALPQEALAELGEEVARAER